MRYVAAYDVSGERCRTKKLRGRRIDEKGKEGRGGEGRRGVKGYVEQMRERRGM